MITIDASAAIKLILEEPGSAQVREAVERVSSTGEPIIAPDIMLAEVSRGLVKHLKVIKDIDQSDFDTALKNLLMIWERMVVVKTEKILEHAARISIGKGISFYDSLYVAVSLMNDAPLLTFDNEILSKGKGLITPLS